VLLFHGVKQATAALVTVSASILLEAGVSPPPPQAVRLPPSKPTIKVLINVLFMYRSWLVFSWPIRIEIRWNFQIASVEGGSQLVLISIQYGNTNSTKRGDNIAK